MMNEMGSTLARLLEAAVGMRRTQAFFESVDVPPELLEDSGQEVPRSVLAMALDLLLLEENLRRVPFAAAYVGDQVRAGRKIVYDHGALRTVKAPSGQLPEGYLSVARILEPLGYAVHGLYPLENLAMTGRGFTHQDLPELIPQFFVSELHPERFSPAFQAAAARVLATSRDPLPAWAHPLLDELRERKRLRFEQARELLPNLAACFDRQHEVPALADYKTLLAESAEMAWISTEGHVFNHATDRVADVEAVAKAEKALGRPMKDEVEVSTSGRVLQTAYRAAEVQRLFLEASGKHGVRTVPGSFFEFITRKPEAPGQLDLRIDAGNAQAIFKMTAVEWC